MQPSAYPEPTPHVERVETHMSWVFLTDRHAYKLKKPVVYDYLDYGTLAARRRNVRRGTRRDLALGAADRYVFRLVTENFLNCQCLDRVIFSRTGTVCTDIINVIDAYASIS